MVGHKTVCTNIMCVLFSGQRNAMRPWMSHTVLTGTQELVGELKVSWSFVFYTSLHFLVGISQVLHFIVVPRIEISVACLGVIFKDSYLLLFKNSPPHFCFSANHWNISREVFASLHFGITGKRSLRRLGIELSAFEPHNNCSETYLYDLSSLILNLFRGWLVRTPASNSGLPDSDIGFRGLGTML